MALTPAELDDYFKKGLDADELSIIKKALQVLEKANPIALTKYIAGINTSEQTNFRIAKAVYKLRAAYSDSINTASLQDEIDAMPKSYGTFQEIADAYNLDHRQVGKIVKGLGIKKKEGLYSNNDITTIIDVYQNDSYGKSIPKRIEAYKKRKKLTLQFISETDLDIRVNKKLSNTNKKTGVFDLD